MRRRIPVTLLSPSGRFLGAFEPPGEPRGLTRYAQFERHRDEPFTLAVAGKIVAAKIANQRRLLQRLDANHHRLDPVLPERLAALRDAAALAENLDALRGCEGAAAAAYLPAWAAFLPEAFPFERRSTRPPLNPVNACLSYVSTLLYGEVLSACHARGLDPAFGHLHPSTDDRWSLPLDLMEPFRPCVAEALTLRLFSHRVLRAEHFEKVKNNGIYLNKEGRRQLLQHYEKTLNREHYSEFAQCRTSLRRQIENTVLHYKTALADPERFAPFRMN
ncbi:MAG: CRISPR-associated endonuclease Cas1 [Akkermansiaceae bacterium]|nr:CRISPR-associated endonuclease Cas1 [Akkermansiaceae bacterium]